MKFIKSPLNYTGSKYKLLNQILPLFPEKIGTFIDLFGGGFNVGINVKNCEYIIYNDINKSVVDLLHTFKWSSTIDILNGIDYYIKKYNLSKTNKEGFLSLREDFNSGNYGDSNKHLMLYVLICYSFNNQIRFNKKGEFNMPFGKDRSSFNPTLKQNLINFIDELHKRDLEFCSIDFMMLMSSLDEEDFVYCDPPYLGSVATYNESNGWTEEDEDDLLTALDLLSARGIKFALSNNLKYENPRLEKWIKKYNVHYLNSDYSNCNYQKIDRSKDCEVLITNY